MEPLLPTPRNDPRRSWDARLSDQAQDHPAGPALGLAVTALRPGDHLIREV